MLELIDVRKVYKTKAGDTVALKGVSIRFADKGLVFISGKSGCGKTTLLNAIGGLDKIDSGEIIIDGKKFSEFSSIASVEMLDYFITDSDLDEAYVKKLEENKVQIIKVK